MKTTIMAIFVGALLTSSSGLADEAKPEAKIELKDQTTCPVMGGQINKEIFVDHDGQRIYVCCAGCIGPLTKDPAKYIAKMAENGEKPAKIQTTCPVMGGKINKELFVDSDGKRIYICCAGCIAPLKKDPAKYIKMLEDEGITLDLTPPEEIKKDK